VITPNWIQLSHHTMTFVTNFTTSVKKTKNWIMMSLHILTERWNDSHFQKAIHGFSKWTRIMEVTVTGKQFIFILRNASILSNTLHTTNDLGGIIILTFSFISRATHTAFPSQPHHMTINTTSANKNAMNLRLWNAIYRTMEWLALKIFQEGENKFISFYLF
jgi:hypothetical protein